MEALTGTATLLLFCPSQLNQASAESDYHDNCRAQWEAQTVTYYPAGERQSLGTKDTLSNL